MFIGGVLDFSTGSFGLGMDKTLLASSLTIKLTGSILILGKTVFTLSAMTLPISFRFLLKDIRYP